MTDAEKIEKLERALRPFVKAHRPKQTDHGISRKISRAARSLSALGVIS